MKKSNQKGFTLLEMLVALAITAIIGLAIGRVVIQVMSVNASSNTRETAIKQVESAVQTISRDALQTQQFMPMTSSNVPITAIDGQITFDLAAPTSNKLVLNWTGWDNSTNEVTYDLINGNLRRTLIVNGGQQELTIVATSITAASGNWHTAQWNPELTDQKQLTFTVTATVRGYKPSIETRTFQIRPSPAQ